MTQVLINSLAGACLNLLIGVSFWLVYAPTRTFCVSHAAAITLGAYGCYWLNHHAGWPFFAAMFMAAVVVALVFSTVENALFRSFGSDAKTWAGLVVSIGLYVVLQNVVSLGFGDETLVLRSGPATAGQRVGDAYVTNTQRLIVLASTGLFIGMLVLLVTTKLGRGIRGVASNRDMCVLLGIEPTRITHWAIGIGSALAAVGGVLSGLDSDITPTMGFRLLMNGVVVMIIGGIGGIAGFPLAALLLALGQHLAAYYFDAKWMDAITFFILIGFLIWKPLGFSGRRLKKVEV